MHRVNTSLVAYLSTRTNDHIESPDRLLITRMPSQLDPWEVKLANMLDDGCAVMYWDERAIEPGPDHPTSPHPGAHET